MTNDQVKPFIHRWVEVYVGNDVSPSYRGVLLPGEGMGFKTTLSVTPASMFKVKGKESDGAIRSSRPVPAADIREIALLGDPEWLVAWRELRSRCLP